jgi:crotonobetainyl-CoA:carnitine CoA-transferase CaiB-like acyl-CoA transferase
VGGYTRERTGPILPNVAPSNVYPTADDQILIGANQDTVFARLAGVMGQPELADDPRYATHTARGEHQTELDDRIAVWTATRRTGDLLAELEEHGVPAGRIYRAADMLDDPHFAARDAIVSVPHPRFDDLRMQNVAPRLSDTPGGIRWAGPDLGQHNTEVYGGLLGIDDATLERLRSDQII